MEKIEIKFTLIIFLSAILAGCSGNPAPSEAIKECINKNGTPYYKSNGLETIFYCVPEGVDKVKFY